MVIESNFHDKSNKDFFPQDYITNIQKLLSHKNDSELLKYVKEIHNADLAEIIQNLDEENRNKFIHSIKDKFDPEILTYLNDSLREEIINKEEDKFDLNCKNYKKYFRAMSRDCISHKNSEDSIIQEMNNLGQDFSILINKKKLNQDHIIEISSSGEKLIHFLDSLRNKLINSNKSINNQIINSSNYIAEQKRISEEKRIADEKRISEQKRINKEKKIQNDIRTGVNLVESYVSYLIIKI